MAFYETSSQARTMACDVCGCVVDGSERGRGLHARWHEPEQVIDLPAVEDGKLRRAAGSAA